jgi:hypothetical protein
MYGQYFIVLKNKFQSVLHTPIGDDLTFILKEFVRI